MDAIFCATKTAPKSSAPWINLPLGALAADLRRVEEYLGPRRSLGYALRIEGDILLNFARFATSTCLTWHADRFIYLINLLDTNETFFYHNLME